MADTNFTSGTPIVSAWLNDVNDATYTDVPALETKLTNVTTISASAATVLDDASVAAMRTTLGAATAGALGSSGITGAAASGANADITSLTTLASINGGPLAGFRNIIINGGFTINQMTYTTGAVLASGVYGHDMWKAGTGGGDYTFTQLSSDTTITIAANKTLIQVIEAAQVQSTSYVLSWTGTATARYSVNSATPAGSYAASPILITGQSVGTVMSIEFGNGASSGTLGKVQLERATATNQATSFEQRPYALELVACQRYFEIQSTTECFVSQDVTNAQAYVHGFKYKVTKRAAPTITLGNNMTGFGAPSTGTIGTEGYRVSATASATAASRVFSFSATIDARL